MMSVLAPPTPKIDSRPERKRWTQAEFHALLLNQAIMPGANYLPALFPGLTINLAILLGEDMSDDVEVSGEAKQDEE